MIRLFIDSTTDIPENFSKKHPMALIPLMVTINGKSYRDRYEISIEELYREMRKGILPKTSLPNLDEMTRLFEEALDAGMDVCYLAFSGEMSGTLQAARLVASDLAERYPERAITVLDSRGGSIATGLIAMQMQLWIEAGFSMDKLVAHGEEMIGHIQHLFTISSLDWLVKGGRLQKQVGYIGDMLSLKPILHVRDGAMHVLTFARGRKNALKKLLAILAERCQGLQKQVIGP